MTCSRIIVRALLAAALGGPLALDAAASPQGGNGVPIPRPRPTYLEAAAPARPAGKPTPPIIRLAAVTAQIPSTDLSLAKQALELAHRGQADEVTAIQRSIQDPAARKLVEWALLRSDDGDADFGRYAAFIDANPEWPSVGMLRRRAEGALWEEQRDPATVRRFFATTKPTCAKGRFALARALLAQGDRTAAQAYVREAWRQDGFSADLEAQVMDTFREFLGSSDHKARMDRRLYANDNETAMRAAHRLGGYDIAIAKARVAVNAKAGNAGALLDAVPAEARRDAGYMFSRIQWLRRNNRNAEAGRLMLAAPRDPALLHDLDEWWVERRLIARKMLDEGDARAAYQIARDAAPPPRENYHAEHEFTAGWIALRFLKDPATAQAHFARVGRGTSNPITLARAEYWQARAAEAAGRQADARAHFEAAARYPTAYYGQIAGARLGLGDITLRQPPEPTGAQRASAMGLEVVRALEFLYALDARDLVVPLVADFAERTSDVGALVMLADLTLRHEDARSMLLIGKAALARGYAFDHFAFPTVGVPKYGVVGPDLDRTVVYAIVRQESAFNQRDVSTAHALGLMQVTPDAGRYVAKKFGVGFDQHRLRSDPVYNTQMGAAELGDLVRDYRGSYILAFAGYNAGRGRVHEWLERYGDPRDPGVDPIDWVERIPFSETRNYVQRVLENLQVYRVRLGQGSRLMIEADLRRGAN